MTTQLTNQASEEEYRLGRALDDVSLFFELNLSEEELIRARDLFARLTARETRFGTQSSLVRRYPALTLATMIGHAGLAYDQGKYWHSFWGELGLPRDTEFEGQLRHALSRLLRRFNLREFTDFTHRNYVMAMAMHSGIPVHCLDDLVDVIEEHVRQGRDATGAALIEWLAAPGMAYRMDQLDVPVRNFLTLGGETAVGILDRIIEFLCFTLENPDSWIALELDTSTTGLPTLILNALRNRILQRPFLMHAGTAATRRVLRRRQGPTVTFSTDSDELVVGIPFPETGEDMPWKVTTGDRSREVYAERGWGAGDDGEHPLTPVSITIPAREVSLRHDATESIYRLTIFDSTDPLLLFASNGQLIERHKSLPRGIVFAMHPKDATVIDAVTNQPIRAVDDPRVPSGWTGWRVLPLDLARHKSIVLQRAGKKGQVRGVRSLGSPSLVPGTAISGLTTLGGVPVYGEKPTVELPAHVGTSPTLWRVQTRQLGERKWLTDDEWESDTEETVLDPFDGVEGALLGQYEILISGEFVPDQRHTLCIAEGVDIEYDHDFRRPVRGGLTPTSCLIVSELGIPVDTDVIQFAAGDRARHITVGTNRHGFRFVVRPPHLEFRIDEVGTPAQWRTSAVNISPEELARHAIIAVRVPNAQTVVVAVLDQDRGVLQSEALTNHSNNVFQVTTRRFVDTARAARESQLVAIVETPSGVQHHVSLASVRPSKLCGGISLDDDELVFSNLCDNEDLGVWVWSVTAPWTPVSRLPINEGRATLPSALRQAGDLIARVFVDDPFAVIARPQRPSPDDFRVQQTGWGRSENPALDQLAQFLAGEKKPPLVAEAAGGAWAALMQLPSTSPNSRSERVRSGLTRILGRNPRAALEALGDSTSPGDEIVALLIRTHLIDRPYSASYTSNELHQNSWVGCMIKIADLPTLRDKGLSAAAERAETVAYLRTQGGPELISLLSTGKMVDPSAGIFSQGDLRYHEMNEQRVSEIFEHAQLVPGPLLNPDTRTTAAFQAFQRREAWTADPMSREVPGHVNRALRAVKAISPAIHKTIKEREEKLAHADTGKNPWLCLSFQSLTLAAVARLESRGEFEYPLMTADMRQCWAVMSEHFPGMVAGDLLTAEALVAHATYGDLIGEGE